MLAGCHYCEVIAQRLDQDNLLCEDDRSAAFLHDDWAVKGHAVLVWKNHVENLSNLTAEDAIRLTQTFADLERVVLEETGAQRAIVMKLGLAVPHLHLHLFPFAASASRDEVFRAINNESHHPATPAEKLELVARLRQRLGSVRGGRA